MHSSIFIFTVRSHNNKGGSNMELVFAISFFVTSAVIVDDDLDTVLMDNRYVFLTVLRGQVTKRWFRQQDTFPNKP